MGILVITSKKASLGAPKSARVKRRPGRRQVFTPAVINMIPQWVRDGASRDDIAVALGVSVRSLNVRCAQYGISLRTGDTSETLIRRLGVARWSEVQRHAQRRGIFPLQLATRVLIAALDGKLIDAILDDAEDGICES